MVEPGHAADARSTTPHGFTALATGTRLSERYLIDHVIAAGGFGITYGARHEGLGRVVAIKEHFPRQFAYRDSATSGVRPSDPATYAWALDRFLQEGRALATCKHPNVVDVTDVFEANGTAYMVLGYENGQSFAQWLSGLGRPPTQNELDALLVPLLEALAFVHAQGLLHRDLAPDNIMIRLDGKPCLIDFGAARQAIAQRSQVMSAIVKTGYSPPEQYTTTGRAQGAWSDIYALGATLYRAVTGAIPPEATERTLDDTIQPARDAVADASAWRPEFLAGIDAALRVRQSERPQTVEAWRAMLLEAASIPSAPSGQRPPAPSVAELEPIMSRPPSAKGTPERTAKADAKESPNHQGSIPADESSPGPRTTTFSRLPAPDARPAAARGVVPAIIVAGLLLAGTGIWLWSSAAGPSAQNATPRIAQVSAVPGRSEVQPSTANNADRPRIPDPPALPKLIFDDASRGPNIADRPAANRESATIEKSLTTEQAGYLSEQRRAWANMNVDAVARFESLVQICAGCAPLVIVCQKAVKSLGELKGSRVRLTAIAQSERAALENQLKPAGVVSVNLPLSEVVPALERGVIDCVGRLLVK